jgi:phosphate transport system permease protein
MHTTPHKNRFANRPTPAKTSQKAAFWIFRIATYLVLACVTYVFWDIISNGAPVIFKLEPPFINTKFLTESPETLHVIKYDDGKALAIGDSEYRDRMAKGETFPENRETYTYAAGGIFPCIVGTVLLVIGSMTIALVLGVSSAIYLSEYAKQGPVIEAIRLAIMNLSGVPSIVFGLFGYGMFVITFGWNVSLMAGWFTLAFMVLPVIITASEESLRAVPKGFREGSLALGATQWQTVQGNVLPYALPGILTSSVLGIARVAGETAPIMFTAAYVIRDELPWASGFFNMMFQGVMALPYHIYVVAAKIPQNEYTKGVQYGTAFIFLLVVMSIALASIIMRSRIRAKLKW